MRRQFFLIKSFIVLMALGFVVNSALFTFFGDFSDSDRGLRLLLIYCIVTVLQLATAIGGLLRARWGLFAGVVTCIICCFLFPIGTLIGVVCLRAYIIGGKFYFRRKQPLMH